MNFFETELKKMTAKVSLLKNPKLVGRACIARLTETTTVKAAFTTLGVPQHRYRRRRHAVHRGELRWLTGKTEQSFCGGAVPHRVRLCRGFQCSCG